MMKVLAISSVLALSACAGGDFLGAPECPTGQYTKAQLEEMSCWRGTAGSEYGANHKYATDTRGNPATMNLTVPSLLVK